MHESHVLAYGYQISVANDQYKLSDFVSAIVYNGTCLICGKGQGGKCIVKVRKIFVQVLFIFTPVSLT